MGNEHVDTIVNDSEFDAANEATSMKSQSDQGLEFIPTEMCGEAIKSKERGSLMPKENHVYREDIVRSSKRDSLVGIVTEVAGDLDSDSSMTDDEEENDDDDNTIDGGFDNIANESNDNDQDEAINEYSDILQDGQARVIWLDHSETKCNLCDIVVIDRGFLHGDIVADVLNPTGQVGIVVDVNILVDLHSAGGKVVKDVSSKDLRRIRDFSVGDYVIFGHWLGRVDDVLDNVTVLFDDGSTCKVTNAVPSQLKPVSKGFLQDAHFPYYPGQHVRASSSSVFKNARWLSGAWKVNRLEGTVIKVQTGSVFVFWLASASPTYGSGVSSMPREEQKPNNLKLLSCFTYANWQLGDWCMFSSSLLESTFSFNNNEGSIQSHQSNLKGLEDLLDKGSDDNDMNSCAEVALETNIPNLVTIQHGSSGSSMDLKFDSDTVNDKNARNHHMTTSGSSSDVLSTLKETSHESWPIHRKKIRTAIFKRERKPRKRENTYEGAFLIANTRTKVDLVWQDGTKEFRRDSVSLIPINNPGDHEFFPEQYVVERPSIEEVADSSELKRVGIIKSVNAKERTACVKWLKLVARPEDPREFDGEEVVSVYELDEHPDYDYCYGDVVVRLSPVLEANDAPDSEDPFKEQVQASSSQGGEMLSLCETVGCRSKDDTDVNFSNLSWVGNITGLQDGYIEVTWADGMVSKVGPQAIYVVGRDDSDDGGSGVSDGDSVSWETVEENEMDILESREEETDVQNSSGKNSEVGQRTIHPEESHSAQNGSLSFPLAAFGFVTRLANGLFNRGKKQSDQLASDSIRGCEPLLDEGIETHGNEIFASEHISGESNLIDDCCTNVMGKSRDASDDGAVFEHAGNKESNGEDDYGSSGSFKSFDITRDPLDNHYYGGSEQNFSGERKWIKKIQQDWSILEKNLPDGICVRVYEDRMDLLRAVIIGAYGTPYQDGLFFFDFHLPPEYPQVPPLAYYHSGGLRLNPNLYEDGKVCLSLLNTWTGKGNEVWDPSSSSILQVLVSLQGLVLNSRPYFNEAGYDKQVGTAEGEKNSLSYNENTFLLNCKSMLYLLRRPPMNFEELVKQHFKIRGYYILKACNAYMEGCLVGSLTKDASRSDRSAENSNSVGFKLMLAKIIPKLVLALIEVGADCQQFVQTQQSDHTEY